MTSTRTIRSRRVSKLANTKNQTTSANRQYTFCSKFNAYRKGANADPTRQTLRRDTMTPKGGVLVLPVSIA